MSTIDPTESIRRELVQEINKVEGSREYLEEQHGEVWDTTELCRDFEVTAFLAPFVCVRRNDGGTVGTLEFQDRPRYYFNYCEDE